MTRLEELLRDLFLAVNKTCPNCGSANSTERHIEVGVSEQWGFYIGCAHCSETLVGYKLSELEFMLPALLACYVEAADHAYAFERNIGKIAVLGSRELELESKPKPQTKKAKS